MKFELFMYCEHLVWHGLNIFCSGLHDLCLEQKELSVRNVFLDRQMSRTFVTLTRPAQVSVEDLIFLRLYI